jgi:hypothetical protein
MKQQKDLALPAPARDLGGPRVSARQDRAIGMLLEGHREEFIAYMLGIRAGAPPVLEETAPIPPAWAARGGDVSWRGALARVAREIRAQKEVNSE